MKNDERILDVISINTPAKLIPNALRTVLDQCPLCELTEDGIIQENAGVNLSGKKAKIYWDVTNINPVTKNSFKGIIEQISESNVKKNAQEKIDLLSLDGSYADLSRPEKDSLGYDFVSVTETEKGLNVKPVFVAQSDMSLRVNTGTMNPELLAKVESDITVLVKNEQGFYSKSDSLSNSKSL